VRVKDGKKIAPQKHGVMPTRTYCDEKLGDCFDRMRIVLDSLYRSYLDVREVYNLHRAEISQNFRVMRLPSRTFSAKEFLEDEVLSVEDGSCESLCMASYPTTGLVVFQNIVFISERGVTAVCQRLGCFAASRNIDHVEIF
jgi:hypothetical protein